MDKISLCMILKDEEKNIKEFLGSIINFFDEIIIVDTGSKDDTIKIIDDFNSDKIKLFHQRWKDDFSKARNFSISKACDDWIIVLDADERIKKQDIQKIKKIIRDADKDTLGFRLIQKTYYKKKIISTRGICRIFRNDDKIRFTYPIHETVRESIKKIGKIAKTGIFITHHPRLSKEKSRYYMRLLKLKKQEYPNSNVDKEIENELKLFNPR